MKNECAKTVKRDAAYEVWQTPDGSWTWYVLKKWQADDDKPYGRWFCDVVTPYCPNGEMGDVYVSEIKANAVRVDMAAPQPEFRSCSHPVVEITLEADVCASCGEVVV